MLGMSEDCGPYALRPLEWVLFQMARGLCQRAVAGLALIILAVCVVRMLARWVAAMDTARAGETTLYNPDFRVTGVLRGASQRVTRKATRSTAQHAVSVCSPCAGCGRQHTGHTGAAPPHRGHVPSASGGHAWVPAAEDAAQVAG